MQNLDVPTVVFALVALFVVFKLRSVLGARNEADRQAGPAGPLRSLRRASGPLPVPANANAAPPSAERWKGFAEPGSPVAAGLDAIAAADLSFSPDHFLAGARAAYEMVIGAFAAGDSGTLRGLLAPEVFDNFDKAIRARASAGHTMTTTLVSIDGADIAGASMTGSTALVRVRFAAKLATVVRDAAGTVVEGAPDVVATHHDAWTFVRDTQSHDPNWALTATEPVS